MIPKPTRWQSKRYRDAARDQNCTLAFCGCINDTATTVLCHRPGAGMGTKSSDHDAADGCHHCHTILDGGYVSEGRTREYVMERFDAGRLKTILNRIERGIIK